MSFPDMWGIHGSQIAESYKFVKIAQIFLRTRRFHAELPMNLALSYLSNVRAIGPLELISNDKVIYTE